MATKYWIKLHHEIIDDPKMGKLSDNLFRRFVLFCLLAGEEHSAGRLPPVADMAWRLRVEQDVLETELDQLSRAGLIEYRADAVLDGYWFVTNFQKRQEPMPKAEYMRRKRKQVRKDRYQGVTTDVTECVTIGNTEEEEDIEEEKEEEEDTAATEIFGQLMDAFCKETGIPEFMFQKGDTDTIRKWVKSGYTPAEIEQTIKEMYAKDLTIARPSSLNSGLMIVRSKNGNNHGRPKEPVTYSAADLELAAELAAQNR